MTIPPTLPGGYQLWYYYPSVPGSIAVASVFTVLALAHLFFVVRTRKLFCIPLIIGAIFEIVGYSFRVYSHYNITSTTTYAIQSVLILLAPILFAASVYMYLGRIIVAVHGERQSIIPVKFLTKVFVAGDVLCFFIQGGGGGLMASADSSSTVKTGEKIILGGLVLQIVIFLFFIAIAWVWHTRMRGVSIDPARHSIPWQHLLISLYIVSILITFRNTVRTVEYGMGSSGYLLNHEWIIFVCDGAPMIIVLAFCLTWYRTDVGRRGGLVDAESQIGVMHEMKERECSR